MAYNTQANRPVVPTPAGATDALHNSTVEAYSKHFTGILTPQLLIANRKNCYATVINGTTNGLPLEQILGTENAKVATEQILNNLTAEISKVS